MWYKSAYILKTLPTRLRRRLFYYHQLEEIDSLQDLPQDDYVKIAFNINRKRILMLMKH